MTRGSSTGTTSKETISKRSTSKTTTSKKAKTQLRKKSSKNSMKKSSIKKSATKKSFIASHSLSSTIEDIWPQERDLMIRPDRYRYVRKLVKTKSCVFCVCAKEPDSFDTLTIFKTKNSMVVLNKYPYNNGHLLVLPRRHCGEMAQLSKTEYIDMMELLRKSMVVLQKAYACEGLNVGMNHGAVAGAGIPNHLHWHVIPRWTGDVNFFPLIAETKVVVESLESSYHRIKEIWQEVV